MEVGILAIGGTECMDHRWRGSKLKFHAGTATTWWLLLLLLLVLVTGSPWVKLGPPAPTPM